MEVLRILEENLLHTVQSDLRDRNRTESQQVSIQLLDERLGGGTTVDQDLISFLSLDAELRQKPRHFLDSLVLHRRLPLSCLHCEQNFLEELWLSGAPGCIPFQSERLEPSHFTQSIQLEQPELRKVMVAGGEKGWTLHLS